MASIGKITGSEITTNKEGTSNVRMLQVKISDWETDDDNQTVEQFRIPGDDSAPIISDDDNDILSKCVVIEINENWKIAFVIDDGIEPDMNAGEKKIYAVDSSNSIVSSIKLLSTGIIEINGNSDFAVAFNDLKTAFDQLKADFNAHVHGGVAAGGASTAVPTPQTTADMSGAKVDTVKLP